MRIFNPLRAALALAALVPFGLPPSAVALSPIPTYPNLLCDSDKVFADSTDNIAIFVHPNGVDDTENIQCALNEAVRQGVPTVQLISTTYQISSLSIAGFTGTLQGTSKSDTVIEVLGASIDCSPSSMPTAFLPP